MNTNYEWAKTIIIKGHSGESSMINGEYTLVIDEKEEHPHYYMQVNGNFYLFSSSGSWKIARNIHSRRGFAMVKIKSSDRRPYKQTSLWKVLSGGSFIEDINLKCEELIRNNRIPNYPKRLISIGSSLCPWLNTGFELVPPTGVNHPTGLLPSNLKPDSVKVLPPLFDGHPVYVCADTNKAAALWFSESYNGWQIGPSIGGNSFYASFNCDKYSRKTKSSPKIAYNAPHLLPSKGWQVVNPQTNSSELEDGFAVRAVDKNLIEDGRGTDCPIGVRRLVELRARGPCHDLRSDPWTEGVEKIGFYLRNCLGVDLAVLRINELGEECEGVEGNYSIIKGVNYEDDFYFSSYMGECWRIRLEATNAFVKDFIVGVDEEFSFDGSYFIISESILPPQNLLHSSFAPWNNNNSTDSFSSDPIINKNFQSTSNSIKPNRNTSQSNSINSSSCIKSKNESSLFVDSSFPPNESSLGDYFRKVYKDNHEWVRASRLYSKGKRVAQGLFDPPSVFDMIRGNNLSKHEVTDNNNNSGSGIRKKISSVAANSSSISLFKQGRIGTCWLVAPLTSLLSSCPGLFDKIFQHSPRINEDGRYLINLYSLPQRCWVSIEVDDFIPCHTRKWWEISASPLFTKPHGGYVWLLLLEKAFAKLLGGYSALRGCHAPYAFLALTGIENLMVWSSKNADLWLQSVKSTCDSNINGNSRDILMRKLEASYENGGFYEKRVNLKGLVNVSTEAHLEWVETVGSKFGIDRSGLAVQSFRRMFTKPTGRDVDESHFFFLMHNWVRRGYLMTASRTSTMDDGSEDFLPNGLVGGHAYSVIDVVRLGPNAFEEEPDKKSNSPIDEEVGFGSCLSLVDRMRNAVDLRLVKIRNPWGLDSWAGDFSWNSPCWYSELTDANIRKTLMGPYFEKSRNNHQRSNLNASKSRLASQSPPPRPSELSFVQQQSKISTQGSSSSSLPNFENSRSGLFWMRFEDFAKWFHHVQLCPLDPETRQIATQRRTVSPVRRDRAAPSSMTGHQSPTSPSPPASPSNSFISHASKYRVDSGELTIKPRLNTANSAAVTRNFFNPLKHQNNQDDEEVSTENMSESNVGTAIDRIVNFQISASEKNQNSNQELLLETKNPNTLSNYSFNPSINSRVASNSLMSSASAKKITILQQQQQQQLRQSSLLHTAGESYMNQSSHNFNSMKSFSKSKSSNIF